MLQGSRKRKTIKREIPSDLAGGYGVARNFITDNYGSSEYSMYNAVNFNLNGGESNGLNVNNNNKYNGNYVRPFLAFFS